MTELLALIGGRALLYALCVVLTTLLLFVLTEHAILSRRGKK